MHVREITEAERKQWNEFISVSSTGHLFQSYGWGEVKRRSGWMPLRIVVEDENGIRAAISILKRKIPLIGRCILYAPRGPVLDYRDRVAFDFLIDAIRALAHKQKAIFFQMDPDVVESDEDFKTYLASKGFVHLEKQGLFRLTQPKNVFRLDVKRSLEEILSSFSQNTRYGIRVAERKKVTIQEGTDYRDIQAFYGMLQETAKGKGFPVRSFSYFHALWEVLVPHKLAKLFWANYEGKKIAGAFAAWIGNKCWWMYGASNESYSKLEASRALQWEIIKWAKANDCTWYDFRGVSPSGAKPSDPGHGVYMFKKSFNPQPFKFVGDYYLIFMPDIYTLWEKIESKMQTLGFFYLRHKKTFDMFLVPLRKILPSKF